MSITGGVVSYEDGKKGPEDYAPPRKVRVELHFEGDLFDIYGDTAKSQVERLLNGRSTATPAATNQNPAEEPAKRTRKPKTEPLPPVEPFHQASPATEGKLDVPAGNTEAAPVLTDKQLYDFVVNTNAEIKKPDAIKDIIVKYSPEGKPPSTKLIPQEKRQAFMDEVKALAESVKK